MIKIPEYYKILEVPENPHEFYICKNVNKVLKLIGINYKSKYNFRINLTLIATENDKNITVENVVKHGKNNFDAHHLWHSVLYTTVDYKILNESVDEGCAYVYGGFGDELQWNQFVQNFKKFATENPNTDWLDLYNKDKKITLSKKYKRFPIQYAINALFVKKIETEQGFPKVKELLTCGKKEEGNSNYFNALEKVTGITKITFNENVWKLINAN